MPDDKKVVYDDAKFALAENLKGDALKVATESGIIKGLVFVTVKYGSKPEWKIRKVTTTPTEFLRQLAKEEGVELEKAILSLR